MERFRDDRKTIGLIIEDLAVDYAKEIIRSVQLAVAAFPNLRLLVLPGLHEHLEHGKTSIYCDTRVHNMIYGLEEVVRVDGLLLTLPNISGVSGGSIFNDEFSRIGYDFILPDGAFYLFMRSPEPDAYAFCERAKKYELLLVPSDDFGMPGFVRIAYCVSTDQVKRSIPAFEALFKEYN